MAVFKGSATAGGDFYSDTYKIPSTLRFFSIVNTHTTTVTITVYVKESSNEVAITAKNYVLNVGQAYIRDTPIQLKPNNSIHINASNKIDYYFSID